MPVPKLGFVLLFVNDPSKSSAFYRTLFGIEPIEQSATFALFALANGVMLGLWSSRTAEPPVLTGGGGSEIAFSEEDIDGLYAKWVGLGIPMAQAPTDMDFGRTFVAIDPDGHRIRAYTLKEAP